MRYKISTLTAILTLMAMTLTSCIMDELDLRESLIREKIEKGFCISFDVELDPMSEDSGTGTRATQLIMGNPTEYESYIDRQNGFDVRVFTCQEGKDYFLFESKARWIDDLTTGADGNYRWQVTIPVYDLGEADSEYSPYWEQIRETLCRHDFKVALYVNHAKNREIKRLWTVGDSWILKGSSAMTINDIHHTVEGGAYNPVFAKGENDTQRAFDMIIDFQSIDGQRTGLMGPARDWTGARSEMDYASFDQKFSELADTRRWIHNNWCPRPEHNDRYNPDVEYEEYYRDYRNLWFLWNFGGAAEDNAFPYSETSDVNATKVEIDENGEEVLVKRSHVMEWEDITGRQLRSWVSEAASNGGQFTRNLNLPYGSASYLKFKQAEGAEGVVEQQTQGKYAGKYLYGVKMPKITTAPTNNTGTGYFTFKAIYNTSVIVTFKGNANGVQLAGASVVSGNISSSTDAESGLTTKIFSAISMSTERDLYLYCNQEGITIYQIDAVADDGLMKSDREGFMPSTENPIPMYGVQKFNKLEDFIHEDGTTHDDLHADEVWPDNTIFHVSKDLVNDYNEKLYTGGGPVFLLRSVAKIELLIPKSLGVPKYVYMKNYNRWAREEPVDVEHNTREIWDKYGKETAGGTCLEIENVRNHGFLYDKDNATQTHTKEIWSWYFGSWHAWGWPFKGNIDKHDYSTYLTWPHDDFSNDIFTDEYPHIMNVYTQVAAQGSFADLTELYNDNYYHYVLYMGDQPVAVPSTPQNATSSNMRVPYMEIRFDHDLRESGKTNSTGNNNITSDEGYQIYIAPKGNASLANGGSYNSNYFSDANLMKLHWPVVRNHIYRFVVNDVSSDGMHLMVDAQHKSVELTFE